MDDGEYMNFKIGQRVRVKTPEEFEFKDNETLGSITNLYTENGIAMAQVLLDGFNNDNAAQSIYIGQSQLIGEENGNN
jgi:hypothetical protein